MVLRNIINIDEDKCNGCGDCVTACVEGAIEIIDGKAKLVSETYCDGLGACIGHCPEDAIAITQREADEFDQQATDAYMAEKKDLQQQCSFSCPGMMEQDLSIKKDAVTESADDNVAARSQLCHWPVQLKLVAPAASYLAGSDLLFTADCVPFSMADFHDKFLKNHSIIVGCPKLDDSSYYIDKLGQILAVAKLNSLTVVRMEVPCCGGLTHIVKEAIVAAGVDLSFKTFEEITIGVRGDVIKTEQIKI